MDGGAKVQLRKRREAIDGELAVQKLIEALLLIAVGSKVDGRHGRTTTGRLTE